MWLGRRFVQEALYPLTKHRVSMFLFNPGAGSPTQPLPIGLIGSQLP